MLRLIIGIALGIGGGALADEWIYRRDSAGKIVLSEVRATEKGEIVLCALRPEFPELEPCRVASQPLMAVMDGAGRVSINWSVVEQVANESTSPYHFYAILFLAIRDKTYKDLP